MKSIFALSIAALLCVSHVSAAETDGGFTISPRVGKSTLTINHDMLASDQRVEVSTLTTGIAVGYVAPFNLMIEAGYLSQGNWDWFGTEDKYRLSEYNLVVGYQIHTPNGFIITPKVGRSRWDLYSRDVALTHPTDLLDPQRERGYDNFWELNLQKQVGKRTALGISYKDNKYQFGNVRTTAFIVSIGL